MTAPSAGGQQRGLAGWLSGGRKQQPLPQQHGGDTGGKAQQDQWGDDAGLRTSLWSPDIAAAMGYGKGGRAGSAFAWWILVCSALLAVGSFIAWAVLVFRARDATDAAMGALGVRLRWWGVLKSILLATAVCYPIFTCLAVAVSLWRASLARKLNIHAPNVRWLSSCRAFQVATVASSTLLYGLFLLMVASVAAHAVWAYTARAGQYGSFYALKYVDPVWSSVGNVVNQTTGLVDAFAGLAAGQEAGSPAPGGRRLTGLDPASGRPVFVRPLEEGDLAGLAPHVLEAGLAAGRSLQQAADLMQVLTNVANGAASALGGVRSAVASGPNLANLLPGGASNPLLGLLQGVTSSVTGQLLNRNGCALYCVDLRDQAWISDGCICNLDRVKAAYPHLSSVYSSASGAIVAAMLMLVASSWLLLHAAAQWARTRSEAKLLRRLPTAADLAAAAAGSADVPVVTAASV